MQFLKKGQLINIDLIIADFSAEFIDENLTDIVKQVDCVVVPIQPLAFNIDNKSDFLDLLAEEKSIHKNKKFIALVGTWVNNSSLTADGLAGFGEQTDFPVLTYLSNAKVYATAVVLGIRLLDFRPSLIAQDIKRVASLRGWVIETTANEK